jgi:lipopolysaccharide/colanic/teichoic acid biosynthesis glycosyltransferase
MLVDRAPLKRALDVIAASVGVLLLAPVLVFVAALVKGDGGPVFYRQLRIGRGGRPFRMWKFRTMVTDAEKRGPSLTLAEDHRITRTGGWLRRSRIDELPQLFNVIAGDMSLVGPRPEVPKFVAMYGADERPVLELVPGITDLASIEFRDEGALLAGRPDPENFYIERIMPEKIRINLRYAADATVLSDIRIILRTIATLATDYTRRRTAA